MSLTTKDRTIVCRITGKKLVAAPAYFETKVKEYKTVEDLRRFYVGAKAKELLIRNFSQEDINKQLDTNGDPLSPEEFNAVKQYHIVNKGSRIGKSNKNFNFTNTTDERILKFINTI